MYKRLRADYNLPSVQTLTRITSKLSKSDEPSFLKSVFDSVDDNQKMCVLLQDEVYVKKTLLYHGGTVFGKSSDNPNALAKTVLGIMLSCMFGGPLFISRMIPISKLSSTFLFDQIKISLESIELSGGHVKAIICDNNRNNQAFFKLFNIVPGRPWLTQDGLFLLYDFVHLLKNIRNNWLTEKMGELVYVDDDGVAKTAKWYYLKVLHKLESKDLVKMSDLTEVSVSPKPSERQNVSHCLKVFSEKTYTALLNHPGLSSYDDVKDTATFINKVIKWWKIVNVKTKGKDVRHNDSLEAVISNPDDERLGYLLSFGEMALRMAGKQGKRQKQLTSDTAKAIFHTCNGLVELCKSLLHSSHKYVMLGKFTSDPLEKEFGKLRQGSGGTYFITVQQIMEKVNINKTKLLLSMNELNLTSPSDFQSIHSCSACGYLLDEEAADIFDNLVELENSVTDENKSVLVYIAGYVTRKDDELDEIELLDHTTDYYEKYGDYTKSLDRGGLNIPGDCPCQWAIFCFILFNAVKSKVCRTSFSNITMMVSEYYNFNMDRRHGNILSNIFLNNFCSSMTPRSAKESNLKVLKLS